MITQINISAPGVPYGVDSATVIAMLHNRETASVCIYMGHDDTPVVQIDTKSDTGRIRVNLNDGSIWDGDPETDAMPGKDWCQQ